MRGRPDGGQAATALGTHLAVAPERCKGCGLCVYVCPAQAVRAGLGYVHIDSAACTACLRCVEACSERAITRAEDADISRVVVGSREEAKALRKAAAAKKKGSWRRIPSGFGDQKAKGAQAKEATFRKRTSARQASARPGAPWGLLEASVAVALVPLSALVAGLILGTAAVQSMPPGNRIAVRAVTLGGAYVLQAVALLWMSRWRSTEVLGALGLKAQDAERSAQTASDAIQAIVTVPGLLILTRTIAAVWGDFAVRILGWKPPEGTELTTTLFGSGWVGIALTVIMVVIAAPVVEEVVFRGIMFGALRGRIGTWPSIVLSAVVFALCHLSLWVALPTFVLGVALGWLAARHRTLWPAIALHALYNGTVVVLVFFLLPVLG
ncbi:MAG: CPBP family glutamic-type intramembrane protease [Coriobacteriia bacterium]|nr:CPBP family glutamic-type intramembrane protease [Coriobacteriia bacterium]